MDSSGLAAAPVSAPSCDGVGARHLWSCHQVVAAALHIMLVMLGACLPYLADCIVVKQIRHGKAAMLHVTLDCEALLSQSV